MEREVPRELEEEKDLVTRSHEIGAIALYEAMEYYVPVDPMDDLQCESCQ